MKNLSLVFLVFFLIGCSSSFEPPASDFSLPVSQRSSADISRIVADIALHQGYTIEANDPRVMASLAGGKDAVSIWLFKDKKHIGNITTVLQNEKIRVMFFKSGFGNESEIAHLETIFREKFE